MKLIATAKRLEDLAAKLKDGLYGRRQPVSLVWSQHEELASVADDGEHVAVDVYESGREVDGVKLVRTVERLVTEASDLGTVYGPDGTKIGLVVQRDGSLITIAYDAGGDVGQVMAAGAGSARPRAVRARRPKAPRPN